MRAIIIEDEKHQQDILQEMLSKNFKNIECVGIAGDIEIAFNLINTSKPDLVFMDIILGDKTCFNLLERIETRSFDIIFTTSYEKYAVKAFRLAAIDYLLKPLALDELKIAVSKIHDNKQDSFDHIKVLLSNIEAIKNKNPKIALPTLTGFILIPVEDIIYCKSDNNYSNFYLKSKKTILVSKTLKSCEQILQEFSFLRVHNTFLVNLRYVKEYIKGEGGIIMMEDGSSIDVSRRRKEEFLRYFKSFKL